VRKAYAVNPDPELNTFDPLKGPLRYYLADGKVKQCPGIVKFIEDGVMNAFEAGCGGYGYNYAGVGSRAYQYGYCDEAARSSMKSVEIRRPGEKVMFTDTAFVQGDTNKYIIEYSFCEPPCYVFSSGRGGILEIQGPVPSIHFRHHGKTNVVWCDGHISAEGIDFPESAKDKPEQFRIGWFGSDDNALFKPWN
jgi:prepilin-type processing-associated H-X9-DG protein